MALNRRAWAVAALSMLLEEVVDRAQMCAHCGFSGPGVSFRNSGNDVLVLARDCVEP